MRNLKNLLATVGAALVAFGRVIAEKVNFALTGYMHNSGLMLSLIPPTPSASDFERYRATDPSAGEILWQPLYDHLLYPLAGLNQFNFFATQQGQGVTSTPGATAGSAKLLSDTNMQMSGQLSSGMEFLAYGLEVYFYPGSVTTANTYTPAKLTTDATAVLLAASVSAVNDVSQFYNEGLLNFQILNKPQLQDGPMRKFTPSNWIELDSSMAVTNATLTMAAMVARAKGDPFTFATPISIQPVTTFTVSINYPALRALPSGFNGRIGVVLNGFVKRALQ